MLLTNDEYLLKLVTNVCESELDLLNDNLDCLVSKVKETEVVEDDQKLPDVLKIFKVLFSQFLGRNEVKRVKAELKLFSPLLTYTDVKYFALEWLAEFLSDAQSTQCLSNAFELLVSLPPPQPEDQSYLLDYAVSPKITTFVFKYNKLRRMYSEVWLAFVRQSVPADIHKRLLLFLPDSVMPHMVKPILLTDFLINSYQKGDTYSLLGLNGLFVLMQKYNLDYPDFYNNLYSLLNSCIFSVPYKAKFFQLLDMFLSSSHLPAYLPAAFAKRLCRLCLTAPTDVVVSVLLLVKNLLARHKAIEVMVNRRDSGTTGDGVDQIATDPYDETAADTSRCRAIESSLWELKTLQRHYCPRVAELATEMCKSHQEIEDLFGVASWDELFDREVREIDEDEDIPRNHVVSKGILQSIGLDRFFMS